jgi:class 3 adenylate cyclase/DNA-binding SARP family transcriptional activator/predicted ATPase
LKKSGAGMGSLSAPKFKLSLLGSFALTGPNGPVDLPSKKLAGLLAYLALTRPAPQSREKLVSLFWGSHFETQARQNLRKALFRLRRALGRDALVSEGEAISLAPGLVACDVVRLQGLIRDGSRAALAEAAGLYKGRLLADVNITEDVWSEWLDVQRQRVEGLALDAMVNLGEEELQVGNHEQALEAAGLAVAVNGLREDAHRLILQALAASGRKAEALKHYENLAALLRRELNTEPDAATNSLIAKLRTTQPASRSPTVKIAKPTQPQPDQPSIAVLPFANMRGDPEHQVSAESPAARGHEASSAVADRAGSPERRQLTIMVCTIVGSIPLSTGLDPEDMRDWIAPFHKVVTDVAGRFDGFVAQYLSDGALVYFGYPAAHEHDAEQAVRAGLAMLAAVSALKATSGVSLQARAGIATGLVVVGEEPGTRDTRQRIAIGETPGLAAQLQAVAAPGEVIIAASTRRLVGGMFDCRALGANELKGLPPSVEGWEVRGETVGVSRFEALRSAQLPLIGREEEVELLLRRWDQAKLGEGRVVLLSGEPGIGKSRLTLALQGQLAAAHTRLIYHGSPYHQDSALHPVISQLLQAAGIARDDSADQKLAKLETLLAPTAKNLKEVVSLFAPLLSIPLGSQYAPLDVTPQRRKDRTFRALLGQLEVLATQQPVLMVLEDAHWFDPTSLELFSLTIERVASLPVLLVITARPEFAPLWPSHTYVSTLTLNRLGRREGEALALSIAKGKALPPEALNHILVHTDGVPLFVEELTKTVLESGMLNDAGDRYVLRGPLPSLAIPATLHASLLARLDRLAAVKDVAQTAATIGREFSYSLIAAVADLSEQDLRAALAQLVAAELIFQRGLPPDARYLFKHALVQDAVYTSLMRSRRQQIHAQIAQALEEQFPDVAASQPEILAHHFTAAGLTERGVVYWKQAGQHACDRSAFVEATRHFNTAIELLKTLPDTPARTQQELALHVDLGAALIATRGHPSVEVEDAYLKAHALCLRMGQTPELAPVLLGLWRCYIARSQLRTARDLAEGLLQLSQLNDDPALAVVAHYALGNSSLLLAELSEARRHFEEGILRYAPEQRRGSVFGSAQDPGVACQGYSALCLWLLGYPDQARIRGQDALALAHALEHPFSVAFAQCCFAFVSQFRRDVRNAYEQAEAAVALATEHGFAAWAAVATSFRGWALSMEGKTEKGVTELQQGMAALRAMGAGIWLPFRCTMLAEAFDLLGNKKEALQSLAEAQTLLDQTEERWWEAEMYRLQGTLLLRHSITPLAEAETWLQRALDVARRQQAKSLELRAATSLARLWRDQGKHREARDMLAPVYGWFTEGFGTVDLREARELLDQLAGNHHGA